jgi:hypothetical protein
VGSGFEGKLGKGRPLWGFHADWGWYCHDEQSDKTRGTHPARACNAGETYIEPRDQIEMSARAGADTIRINVNWNSIEPAQPARNGVGDEAHSYRWDLIDEKYESAAASGLRPILVLWVAPEWARQPGWEDDCHFSQPCGYPPSTHQLGNWQDYAEAVMRRYPTARAVEVWNEQNLSRFWAGPTGPQPELYAKLLQRVHRAREEAGFAGKVITGGLAPAGRNSERALTAKSYLKQTYRYAKKWWFDGIGAHPYAFTVPRVKRMWRQIRELKRVRNNYGDRKTKFWLTEIGISNATPPSERTVPTDQQGPVLKELYDSTVGRDVRAVIFYTFREDSGEGDFWVSFGVTRSDLEPKPAYRYLKATLGRTRGPR